MKRTSKTNRIVAASAAAVISLSTIGVLSPVFADTTSTTSGTTSTTSTSTTTANRLATLQSKGAAEITRRITSLNAAAAKLNSLTKITTSDKAYLSNEINTEISGLTSLQSKLAADTTLSDARTDVKSIYTDYRVYALLLPKTWIVKAADGQQVAEGNLTALASKLQSRLDSAKESGKEVTQLQNELNDMETQTRNAQAISQPMEQKVLTLQPSDFNSDHSILSGDVAQLKTAHADNQAAFQDAKNIISELKTL
ncbi:MAG TPA: hypothetical protein VFN56_01585 [Candidatus Saccharimonadales bacterium]|nr:hypothetical protein [Candidatus Saccharimonadales bacterium]